MKVIRRAFKSEDFDKVRDFLKDTYKENSSNWCIERWSWSRFFNGHWLENFDTWPSTVGMWVDEEDQIVAIVLDEGEIDGDVFFQLRSFDYTESLINEMIDFSEAHLCGSHKKMYPRVNNLYKDDFMSILKERGYSNSGRVETDSTIAIEDKYEAKLPKGFRIEPACKHSAEERALAHGKAFSVDPDRVKALMGARTRAYTGLSDSPDYNESLDLCIVDENEVIAAFATFWFDDQNMIGTLEPLGTVTGYQKLGLGKTLVYEGMKRLGELGATKLHVGSDQIFYKKIGFTTESETEIWQKDLSEA